MDLKSTVLGIELGSTRIKAVLLDSDHKVISSGSYSWENKLINGIWTYSMDEVHTGIRACYADLKRDFKEKHSSVLKEVGAIGISGMMHGYLPFDKDSGLLAEFRTWRNTVTGRAAEELTSLFGFNIPQRWSIAHLYQAMLNGEDHISEIDSITTLAGYVHFRLTGERVMGIGEASGMFPIDSEIFDYDRAMLEKFDSLPLAKKLSKSLGDILPKVLVAGKAAGRLTPEGALFLDPDGDLLPGIPFCPPEGDAGTGMTATNSVAPYTGNVSAGTSDFAMIVVDRPLGVHREIDMVTTPSGLPVAMVHCNNCTSDINAWVNLFGEFARAAGLEINTGDLYTLLFKKALEGDADCGGLLSYNYFSGEGITDLDEGRPVFMRESVCSFTLANFMRTHLLSALATLKIGLDILTEQENIKIEKLYGHGGYFKTPEVGQRMLSAAVGSPVSVMETAGEGGPYGMALLASFMLRRSENERLEDFLENKVFACAVSHTVTADQRDIEGFERFLKKYASALEVEKAAIKAIS
ncbi:MAG: FGGY-family carbohydrate kinase [Clostridia bacterium]|nr:FGGY-family carbohydrate kinase [Clostridia bacterium]